jgi:hypothetical protein
LRGRVLDALSAHDGRERARGRRLSFVTFTMRARPTMEETARALQRGFERWRAWLASAGLRDVRYARVAELGDGQRGGHVHFHVLMWLPFVSYKRAGKAWVRATGGAAEAQGVDFKRVRGAADRRDKAALYASKAAGMYAAKAAGPDATDASADVLRAADWYGAMYARRLYTASRRFWVERIVACDCGAAEPRGRGLVWRVSSVRPASPRAHGDRAPPCAPAD